MNTIAKKQKKKTKKRKKKDELVEMTVIWDRAPFPLKVLT
jgi:hypothetical protein